MSITKFDGILYGGDYCPEQWDEHIWLEDIQIMKYFNVNAVTLNVHSWCILQPKEGPYDFTKMDKMIKLLTDNQINIIMATGTAALPNWLLNKYPDMMAEDITGVRHKPGKRVNYCPNSPDYLREIKNMCEALADHYKAQENIVLWHLNNELEINCYCTNCAGKYREWLKTKYGSLKALNQKWNTMFWGHQYSAWEEINPPVYANMIYRNLDGTGIDISGFPTETIEYLRYMSISYRNCFEIEKEAIRKYIPDAVVTNNFQYRNFNYDILAKPLDVVSFDTYPSNGEPAYKAAFNYDITRGMNGLKPFLIMEMSPNQASWEKCAPIKRPGQVAQIAMGALARGAESAMFFQIRRSRSGFEKFHGAMIDHSGRTDTRLGRELMELGNAFKKLKNTFLDSKIPARTAIIMDWDCRWGVEIPSSVQKNMHYLEEVLYYYEWLHAQNIMVDVVRADSDFSGYDIVLGPMLYMIEENEADNIKAFVENGGTFITTYYSGLADKEDNIWMGGYPALWKDMLGLWVEETDALKVEQSNIVQMSASWLTGDYRCGFLCDLIRAEGARVLGTYGDDFYQGIPCITENEYGAGKAVYIGTKPEKKLLNELLKHYCDEKNIEPILSTQAGVEAVMRMNDDKRYLFLFNHNINVETVALGEQYKDVLQDVVIEKVELPVMGYAILEKMNF